MSPSGSEILNLFSDTSTLRVSEVDKELMLGPDTEQETWAMKHELLQLPYGKMLHFPQSTLFYHPSTLSRAPHKHNSSCRSYSSSWLLQVASSFCWLWQKRLQVTRQGKLNECLEDAVRF